nr:hypothetical protein Iba_chr09dCG12600 [Ipomoea batatas]
MKADSEATVETGIANKSFAILLKVGYFFPSVFHHDKTSKSSSNGDLLASKYKSNSDVSAKCAALSIKRAKWAKSFKPTTAEDEQYITNFGLFGDVLFIIRQTSAAMPRPLEKFYAISFGDLVICRSYTVTLFLKEKRNYLGRAVTVRLGADDEQYGKRHAAGSGWAVSPVTCDQRLEETRSRLSTVSTE